MKKVIFILLCSFICVTMSACNKEYKYTYHQPKENIICITYVDEIGQMKIAEAKHEALLADVQRLPCRKYWNDPEVVLSMPYIVIEYANGCCEKISASVCYYYTENNGISEGVSEWLHFDQESFSEVLNKYK